MKWDFPLIKRVRMFIRSMTPGELPPISMQHPIRGLVHDIQRLIRRKIGSRF